MSAGRSNVRASAWRTRLSAKAPVSVRIQIWRCSAAGVAMMLKFVSSKSALPDRTSNWTIASTWPPW